ncbi:MAG: hypothetical protein IKG98_01545 [Ruminococcus sp.]|nr:hypothetical protein [Ruminococcus sp.]
MKTRKFLSAALTLAIMCGAPTGPLGRSFTVLSSEPASAAEPVSSDNPYNKQDDEEVLYDGSSWVQPKEWNTPKIDPRDYEGGIMLFFDKIGLEPEYAKGKVQRVYFSVVGVEEPVNMMRFHFFYDTRLKVRENPKGEVVTAGTSVEGFTTGSVMVEEGQLEFYAYSEERSVQKGSIFTVDFVVPEDADSGEVYPFGIVYVVDDVGKDLFIDRAQSGAGRLQMTYVFTKGLHSGWIKIAGEKRKPALMLGDPNGDGKVDAKDATFVLGEYALRSTDGVTEPLPLEIETAADVNADSFIDAKDASSILAYYSYISTGGTGTMEDFLAK